MILNRLACLKHITYAVLALVLLVCATEVALRAYDSYTGQLSTDQSDVNVLVRPSWLTHHSLIPLEVRRLPNPDTDAPIDIRVNSFGLRGEEVAMPKPAGVYRIVCLGDESTLAPAMKNSETFCTRLEDLLQNQTPLTVEVLNAGVPEYCPLLSYLQVRHSLLALQPDLMILNFDMSDVADDQRYRRHTDVGAGRIPLACTHPLLQSKNEGSHVRVLDNFLIPKLCIKQLGCRGGACPVQDLTSFRSIEGKYGWLTGKPGQWHVYVSQSLSPIKHLEDLADSAYFRLVVASYPVPGQVSPQASDGPAVRAAAGVSPNAYYKSRAPFELLEKTLGQWDIPFCDTSTAFMQVENPERMFLKNAGQFSRLGHELYARELAAFLLRNISGVWSHGSPYRRPLSSPRHSISSKR